MLSAKTVVLSVILSVTWCAGDLTFPPGFKFGVASSAYQVEGSWNVSDKGENIWDHFTHHNATSIVDGSNADVACDSYRLWRRDIEMAFDLGVHFYRFSISWSRLLPTGFHNYISEDGKNYYNKLIDGLLEKGIQPIVTLYHFDLPQRLQNLGGWTNPLISDWFADYARVVYTLYGDRVKTWITINEPLVICDISYRGVLAPGVVDEEIGGHLCSKHILVAHAKAWRIYDEEFRSKYHGEVSLANHHIWIEAATEEDEDLAELARQHLIGRYSHSIYSKKGGWPTAVEKLLAEISKKQGYQKSNLPAFTKEEIELVKGSYDFYGVNHYTSRLIRKTKEGEKVGTWPLNGSPDLNATLEIHPDWSPTSSWWFYVDSKGFRQQLVWLKKQYGNIKFLITENGFAGFEGLNDTDRIEFYKANLKQLLLAIKEDSVNVSGYTAWTLMDNFGWTAGYTSKFGLYEVDFSSPERTRKPRASAHFYNGIIQSHSLDVPEH